MTVQHQHEAISLHPAPAAAPAGTLSAVADLAAEFSRRFIIDGSDLRMLFRDLLLNGILTLTQSEFGYIAEVLRDADGNPYLKVFGHALTDISWDAETADLYQQHLDKGLEFHNLDTMFGACLRSGAPVIVSSPNDPRRGGIPRGHPPINNFLAIPLRVDGEVRGQLALANRPGGYDHDILELLQPALDCSATAMVMARADRDRRRAQELLAESHRLLTLRQFEEADTLRAQGNFVSAVLHELRTPVSALLVYATALAEDSESATRPLADAVLRNTRRLASLTADVDALLTPARPAALESVELCSLVKQTVMDSLAAAQELYGSEPTLSLVCDCDVELHVNQEALARTIGNLVINAVKFGEGSPIEIVVRTDRDTATIAVIDHGVGMSAADAAHCCEPFFRGSNATHGLGGGAGLGLALAERTVEAHGGHLDISSRLGEGTCATITLPIR